MENLNIVDDIINNKNNEPTPEELETFKNLVNDWFKYDDQIRKLNIAMKERKHGRIKTNVKECKVPIKMNDIKTKIIKHNDLSGEELLKKIFEDERETFVRKNIKRIIPKVSLTL